MSIEIQRRRGTTAAHSTFTGAAGELTVDTSKNTIVVHDGVTVGGHPLPTASNLALKQTALYTPTLTGGVTRSVEGKLLESVSVKDFGAVGDGITNDTTAVSNAIAAVAYGGTVFFPRGNYSIDPIAVSGATFVTLLGENRFASTMTLRSTGVALTLSNCQFMVLRDLGFIASGVAQVLANATGVKLDTGSSNCVVDCCLFQGLSQGGLKLIGTVGTPLSGNRVENSYFLGNGSSQFLTQYNNDFHIENNQYGELVGITHAAYGCLMEHSSAGLYHGNLHWGNVVGHRATSCHYNTWANNRFEMSDSENVYLDSCGYFVFANNKAHTASLTADGVSNNVYLTACTTGSVNGNLVFSWNATYSKWGIYVDGVSTDINLAKNKVSGFSTSYGAIYWGGAPGTNVTYDFHINGMTHSVAAANQTTYIGPNLLTFAEAQTTFQIPKRCQIMRAWAGTDVVPGAGQTFTYTLRKNAADTTMTMVISGAASFSAAASPPSPAIILNANDHVSMKLTTSATAAAANHRFYVEFAEI